MSTRIHVVLALVLCSNIASADSGWWTRGAALRSPAGSFLDGEPSPLQDPKGDAQNTLGAGPPLLDIDVIDINYGGGNLNFLMTFFTPIAAPSTGLPQSVIGIIELDTDQRVGTGQAPLQNAFSPPFASLSLGADYTIDLFSEILHPGLVDISIGPLVLGTVPIHYTANSLSGTIPLSLLRGDDGLADFTAIIGTVPQPTDATGVVGTSVPEPATGFLLLAAGLAAARRRQG